MQITLACLADHASIDQSGKLNISGVFDAIQATSLPAVHAQMYLVLRIGLDFDDNRREHKLLIELRDPDGKELAKLGGDVAHGKIPAGENPVVNQILQLGSTKFVKAGRYTWIIATDGKVSAKVGFDVRLAKEVPHP